MQLAALNAATVEAFVRKEHRGVMRAWPSRCVHRSEEEILADLLEIARLAAANGITSEATLTAMLHLRMKLGFRFPLLPPYRWAAAILTDRALTESEKVDLLREGALTGRED